MPVSQVLQSDREQVAVDRTSPKGRVLGIDVIPAQPPKGVSTIQGNFLSKTVQEEVKRFLVDPDLGRARDQTFLNLDDKRQQTPQDRLNPDHTEYFETESTAIPVRAADGSDDVDVEHPREEAGGRIQQSRTVDVLLSDMSAPWPQTEGFWKRSLSNPYCRMMNTSGIILRDHAGSMVTNI